MRQQVFKLSVAILFLFSLCFPSVIFADPVAQANPPEEKKEEVAKEEPKAEKPMPIKEAIKALEPGDPRQAQLDQLVRELRRILIH